MQLLIVLEIQEMVSFEMLAQIVRGIEGFAKTFDGWVRGFECGGPPMQWKYCRLPFESNGFGKGRVKRNRG